MTASSLNDLSVDEIVLHGHRIAYRKAGVGPNLVMIHGVAGSMRTWDAVVPGLARHSTVITPDLPGHGRSSKPRADYSLGAYACCLRDLLDALGHDRATVVGHSFGGGIAMQFAYQFPERCERLVLVASGGLGDEVNVALRAATLPGSELVIPLIAHRKVIDAGRTAGRWAHAVGLAPSRDLVESARGYASLADADARRAFLATLRSAVDHRGQRIDARDRLYLAEHVPTLLMWGDHDRIIPVDHGYAAHRDMPASRLEIFDDAGHHPHIADPDRFVDVLTSFVDATEPAEFDRGRLRQLLKSTASQYS